LGLPKLAQENSCFDCLFTINRYKLIFDTGACFGSYKGVRADFRNLEDFAKYLPEVSIAATCGGIPIKPLNAWLHHTHRGSNTGSFN
jgi:hypothetical protein